MMWRMTTGFCVFTFAVLLLGGHVSIVAHVWWFPVEKWLGLLSSVGNCIVRIRGRERINAGFSELGPWWVNCASWSERSWCCVWYVRFAYVSGKVKLVVSWGYQFLCGTQMTLLWSNQSKTSTYRGVCWGWDQWDKWDGYDVLSSSPCSWPL